METGVNKLPFLLPIDVHIVSTKVLGFKNGKHILMQNILNMGNRNSFVIIALKALFLKDLYEGTWKKYDQN